jgi:hypothetical protein
MPVLESTDNKIAHKSILRHRPIDGSTAQVSATLPIAQRRASRARKKVTSIDNVPAWKYATNATDRQKGSSPSQAISPTACGMAKTSSRQVGQSPTTLSKRKKARRQETFQGHLLLSFGLGIVVMLTLWMLLCTIFAWVTTGVDDLRYGRPRTFQTDAYVGHNEQAGKPSHFIALNLNRHIEIIEIAGGDPSHTRIYTGPQLYGPDDNLTVVTLRFVTPPGKKYPNMVVLFHDVQVIYANENGVFIAQ